MTDWKAMARSPLLAPAALVLAVLAVYGQTLSFSFVWDDTFIIAHVQEHWRRGGIGGLLASDWGYDKDLLKNVDMEETGYWRPLTSASIWLDGLFSSSPRLFHAVNVLLYCANVLLLFHLGLTLIPGRAGPFAAALLFALWPLHTETAAFVTNRHDLLAGGFALLSALAWRLDRRGPGKLSLAALGGAALAAAGLAKESALVLPAALVLWDLAETGEPGSAGGLRGWWARNRKWLPVWIASVGAVLLLRLAFSGQTFGVAGNVHPGGEARALLTPALLAGRAALYLYLQLVPWPVLVWYGAPQVALSFATAAGSLLFLGLGVLTWGRKWDRWGVRLLAWTAVMLLPVSELVPIPGALAGARHLYLASAGTCLFLGYLFHRGISLPSLRRWAQAGFILLAAALAAGAFAQTRVWRDDLSLYGRWVRDAPMHAKGHHNLGNALLRAGRTGEAIPEYQRALVLDPSLKLSYAGLGDANFALGRWRESADQYARAARAGLRDAIATAKWGIALMESGSPGEALDRLREARRMGPDYAFIHAGMGDALAALGRRREAEEEYRAAARLEPGNPEWKARLLEVRSLSPR